MLRLQDLLSALRQSSLPRSRLATERQIEAIEQLGLGSPPSHLTIAEASAILTARSVAREVLHDLGGIARMPRVTRLQLEPCIIYAILNDRQVLSELTERNKRRWGFCKKDDPPPSGHTRTIVFGEAQRFINGVP